MRKPIFYIIIIFALSLNIISNGFAKTSSSKEILYQVSTIDALMTGLYDGTTSVKDLIKHGDIGIGTFDRLDGEMIIIDGKVYKITADGKAHTVGKSETTPFAAVTYFNSDIKAKITEETSFAELTALIDSMLPSNNLFYAIRIDGTFSGMKTRSVPKQTKPYAKLVQITASQPVFEFNEIRGSIAGFRSPYFVKSVNVPGYHLHFISEDKTRGGHILDMHIKDAVISLDITPEFRLNLPDSEAFLKTNIDPNTSNDLEKVEKSAK